MRKTISVRDVARLKRNAQNVYPLVATREKLAAKKQLLDAELEKVNAEIEATETGSRLITGGVNSMDVIRRVVITTDKVDRNGAPVKVTKFEPIPEKLIATEDGAYEVVIPDEAPEAPEAPAEAATEPANDGTETAE